MLCASLATPGTEACDAVGGAFRPQVEGVASEGGIDRAIWSQPGIFLRDRTLGEKLGALDLILFHLLHHRRRFFWARTQKGNI
jgi:hypothetical protein